VEGRGPVDDRHDLIAVLRTKRTVVEAGLKALIRLDARQTSISCGKPF
jgi:hypothetical protein